MTQPQLSIVLRARNCSKETAKELPKRQEENWGGAVLCHPESHRGRKASWPMLQAMVRGEVDR